MVRTPPFQGENPGSNPSGAATMSSRAIYRDASGMPRRAVPERNYYDHQMVVFILCLPPDENRRFDTIVGKNKRNTLRDVRALRVVSNANNPSGAAKIKIDPFGSFFILCLPPDENRRFDTIVGKNKRNALRAVRTLRVVSNANNPSGAAKIKSDPFGCFFD